MGTMFKIKKWWWNLRRSLHLGVQYIAVTWARLIDGRVGFVSTVSARHWSPEEGWTDFGVIGIKCITDVFCNLIVDCLQGGASGLVDLATFKYHDCGTGTTAEDQTDTSLGAPTGMARVVGTQIEGSSAYIYKSVATITSTISGTTAITEYGLFHEPTGGILMDRAVFAAINLELGNKIEFTYQLSVIAGG